VRELLESDSICESYAQMKRVHFLTHSVDTDVNQLIVRFERSISIGCRDTEWDTRICNPLMGTLKPQSNGPLYSNTVTGTLAVDEWAVTLVQRGGTWAGCGPAQSPPRCTKCNSPPINGQCTNFMLFDAAL